MNSKLKAVASRKFFETAMKIMQETKIRDKFITFILLACTVGVVSAGITLIVRGQNAYLNTSSQNLSLLAELVANNCTASLAFDDSRDAEETLNLLKSDNSVVFCCIYDKRGKIFASYHRDGVKNEAQLSKLFGPIYSSSFYDGKITILKPLVLNDEIVGTIRLLADLNPICVTFKRDTATIIAVQFFVSLAFMFLLYALVDKNLKKIMNSVKKPVKQTSKVVES